MWTHLLWKNARQVIPVVTLCFVFTIIAQLLMRWRGFVLAINELVGMPADLAVVDMPRGLAMVGPILVVLACTAILIGTEKQNRTLHWLSTLPIPWYRSLASQFLIATLCTGVTIAFSYTVANVGRPPIADKFTALEPYRLASIILVASELLIISTILLLVFEEPLYGLAGAGLVTILINSGAAYLWQTAINQSSELRITQEGLESLYLVGFTILGIIAIVAMIALYRWRWYASQPIRFADVWSLFKMHRSQLIATPAAPVITVYPDRPFVTLLVQSIRQYGAFLIFIMIASAIGIAFSFRYRQESSAFFAISVFLLGISCFIADHSKQRFRFLSDRGVSTWKFYFARTIPKFVITLVVITAVEFYLAEVSSRRSFRPQPFQYRFAFYVSTLTLFFTGHLVGLCFRNVLIAIVAAFATIFIPISFFTLATSFDSRGFTLLNQYSDLILRLSLGIQCSWMVTVAIVALIWTVPRWFQRERSEIRLGIGYVISGIVIPCLLFVIAALGLYWNTPEPSWSNPTLLLAKESMGEPKWVLSLDTIEWGNKQYWNNSTIWKSVRDRPNVEHRIFSYNKMEELQGSQVAMEHILTTLKISALNPGELQPDSFIEISSWSFQFLRAIKTATVRRDRGCFDQATIALLKLQQFNFIIDPVSRMLQQISMIEMFQSCSDDDLRWMLESQSLKPLLTDLINLEEYRQWSITRAKAYQEALKAPTLTPKSMRMFDRFRMEHSIPFEKPNNFFLSIPYALINQFILSSMSREFTAEMEATDELIAKDNKASESRSSVDEDLQVYLNARSRHGLPDLEQSPLSVNLSHVLRSREKSREIQMRMEANGKEP
jgi:hypothetical protein